MKDFYFIYIFFRYISREKIEEIGYRFSGLKVSRFSPSTPNTDKKMSNGPLCADIFFASIIKEYKKMANGSFFMKVFYFFLNKRKEIGKSVCIFTVHDVSIFIQSLLDLRINLLHAQYP